MDKSAMTMEMLHIFAWLYLDKFFSRRNVRMWQKRNHNKSRKEIASEKVSDTSSFFWMSISLSSSVLEKASLKYVNKW